MGKGVNDAGQILNGTYDNTTYLTTALAPLLSGAPCHTGTASRRVPAAATLFCWSGRVDLWSIGALTGRPGRHVHKSRPTRVLALRPRPCRPLRAIHTYMNSTPESALLSLRHAQQMNPGTPLSFVPRRRRFVPPEPSLASSPSSSCGDGAASSNAPGRRTARRSPSSMAAAGARTSLCSVKWRGSECDLDGQASSNVHFGPSRGRTF